MNLSELQHKRTRAEGYVILESFKSFGLEEVVEISITNYDAHKQTEIWNAYIYINMKLEIPGEWIFSPIKKAQNAYCQLEIYRFAKLDWWGYKKWRITNLGFGLKARGGQGVSDDEGDPESWGL